MVETLVGGLLVSAANERDGPLIRDDHTRVFGGDFQVAALGLRADCAHDRFSTLQADMQRTRRGHGGDGGPREPPE